MQKRKLKRAKYTNEKKTYTKDTNEQVKVNTRRLPRKQMRDWMKTLNTEINEEKVLHLDSTFRPLSVEHERNN